MGQAGREGSGFTAVPHEHFLGYSRFRYQWLQKTICWPERRSLKATAQPHILIYAHPESRELRIEFLFLEYVVSDRHHFDNPAYGNSNNAAAGSSGYYSGGVLPIHGSPMPMAAVAVASGTCQSLSKTHLQSSDLFYFLLSLYLFHILSGSTPSASNRQRLLNNSGATARYLFILQSAEYKGCLDIDTATTSMAYPA